MSPVGCDGRLAELVTSGNATPLETAGVVKALLRSNDSQEYEPGLQYEPLALPGFAEATKVHIAEPILSSQTGDLSPTQEFISCTRIDL
jgi:hypothetical protein